MEFTNGNWLTPTAEQLCDGLNLVGRSYYLTELMAVAVARCRAKFVQASHSSERKRPDDVGDRAPVLALRREGCLPVKLHRRRPSCVPAVPETAARRRPRSTGHPGAALSVGVRADDRRTGGAADRRGSPDGPNVGVGAVRYGTDGRHGASRRTRVSTAVRHRGRAAS